MWMIEKKITRYLFFSRKKWKTGAREEPEEKRLEGSGRIPSHINSHFNSYLIDDPSGFFTLRASAFHLSSTFPQCKCEPRKINRSFYCIHPHPSQFGPFASQISQISYYSKAFHLILNDPTFKFCIYSHLNQNRMIAFL